MSMDVLLISWCHLHIIQYLKIFIVDFFYFSVFVWDRVSQYSSGCSGTHYVKQAILEHTKIHLSAGIKGMCPPYLVLRLFLFLDIFEAIVNGLFG